MLLGRAPFREGVPRRKTPAGRTGRDGGAMTGEIIAGGGFIAFCILSLLCDLSTKRKNYPALFDVLRLSRGMTYKAACAGLNLGGGKAVILGDAKKIKSEALYRFASHPETQLDFGKFID